MNTEIVWSDITLAAEGSSELFGKHIVSPGGYSVIKLYKKEEGGWQINRTNTQERV